jgi:hypothetical protein
VQGKHKATKFTCKQRAALLTVLYQSIAAAGGGCPISRKVLGCAAGNTRQNLRGSQAALCSAIDA